MGKKKSDIYVCFQILPYKNKANKSIFQCKFCDRQYLQNATKMESHIITQCQKVPAGIRASYTTKPGNNGGGGGGVVVGGGSGSAAAAAALTGLNLSLMNKHDDLDLNDLIRDYSDSSASEAPEQMVVNCNVPGMFRMGKGSSPSAAGSSGGSSGGNGRGGGHSNNHSPSGLALSHQNPDYNQRSMQIRAFSQLVTGFNNNQNNGSNTANGGGNSRKRPRIDNHNNNNNNNAALNNNYYTIGASGNPNKILIKPSHGVPASKLPNLGGGGRGANSNSGGGGNNNANIPSLTAATLTATSGGAVGGGIRKLKPPLLAGATITKNANLNNNSIGGFKEKLTREETVEIWRLLARAIYSSNVPVTILENEHWVNVMQRIQPTLTLPSTSILSNALLDQEYSRLGQDIEEKVEKSHFAVLECVTVPGSRADEFTLVFYVNCDDSPNPYLYKTHRISPDSGGYTKDNLSEIIKDTMMDIGVDKVVAFMSDLNSEMEATWEILRDKFPGLLTFGCVIHGLNSILDKILLLSEIGKMIDIIKKLYNKIEKSQELKKLIEDAKGKKHISPFDEYEEEMATAANDLKANNDSRAKGNCSNANNNNSSALLTKWKLVGKLIAQLISEKAVYQQLLGKPDSKKIIDGLSSDSPSGKCDRSLSNHLSSESFWTSLHSINSIIVPCLQWIDALKPDRDCSLSEIPELFKELKLLLQTHVRNFPVDDTTKQSVHKHFLQLQRKCVNEIHFTSSLLNPSQRLRGILTEDEEAQGVEFLTYFCDSRGYNAGSILKELADYKSMNGAFATEKIWKLGNTMDVHAWWKMVQGESALSSIAISLGRVVPSCSIPEQNIVHPDFGESLDADKSEKLGFIQYNLQKPNSAKLPKMAVVVQHPEKPPPPKETPPPPPLQAIAPVPVPAPAPAKIEKLRIKIPKKEDSESPAIDLSARLSGCSQVSDEEEDEDDDDSGNEESPSSATNSVARNDKATTRIEQSPPPKQDDDQSSDDGSTKDGSSSDSDDSSSDDQSD